MRDEDSHARRNLKVVLVGSAPLMLAQGLSERLAVRLAILHVRHWPFDEMRHAFGWTVEQFIYYVGYPGAAPLGHEPERWQRCVLESLVETSSARDVLLRTRVDMPALLRRLLELACRFSGQVLSHTKMLGQRQDVGNTTTLAHYLELLEAAGMVCGIPKYAGDVARRRASRPKLLALNTAR